VQPGWFLMGHRVPVILFAVLALIGLPTLIDTSNPGGVRAQDTGRAVLRFTDYAGGASVTTGGEIVSADVLRNESTLGQPPLLGMGNIDTLQTIEAPSEDCANDHVSGNVYRYNVSYVEGTLTTWDFPVYFNALASACAAGALRATEVHGRLTARLELPAGATNLAVRYSHRRMVEAPNGGLADGRVRLLVIDSQGATVWDDTCSAESPASCGDGNGSLLTAPIAAPPGGEVYTILIDGQALARADVSSTADVSVHATMETRLRLEVHVPDVAPTASPTEVPVTITPTNPLPSSTATSTIPATATHSPTSTATHSPTAVPSQTPSATSTASATSTSTASVTATASPTATPTETARSGKPPKVTAIPTATAIAAVGSPTPKPTRTPRN
jgi:hypothetical protein